VRTEVGDVRVHHVEHGDGVPFVVLHGAGVDHREVEGALEPMLGGLTGVRRVYPDLPAHGATTTPPGLTSNDGVVEVLLDFVDEVAGDGPFLVGGHSLGGYLAGAVAARRRDRVAGLALVCPARRTARDVPPPTVVRDDADARDVLDPADVAGFEEYLVVRTARTARCYRDLVVPGAGLTDEDAFLRVYESWALRDAPGPDDPQPYPTIVLAGRQDSSVGWSDPATLVDVYPHGTLAVLDGAGHALLHEQPDVVAALLRHWLAGVGVR